MTDARRLARRAESKTALRGLARAGYAASGAVHILVGILVLVVTFGGEGIADQGGAFLAIAAAPLGFAALWVIAVALCALGVWHALEAVLVRREHRLQTWGMRISEGSQALVFVALGLIAAAVALGARPNADRTAQDVSRGVLVIPGGPIILGLVGLTVGIIGVSFVVMGVLRSFENKVDLPDGPWGAFLKTLGVVGFIAKGIALFAVGILVLVAALRTDPSASGALDAAITALLEMPFGPPVAIVVGVGLIIYGVFLGFRARYARL